MHKPFAIHDISVLQIDKRIMIPSIQHCRSPIDTTAAIIIEITNKVIINPHQDKNE